MLQHLNLFQYRLHLDQYLQPLLQFRDPLCEVNSTLHLLVTYCHRLNQNNHHECEHQNDKRHYELFLKELLYPLAKASQFLLFGVVCLIQQLLHFSFYFSTLFCLFLFKAFSELATIVDTALSPVTLTTVLSISRILSTPKISAIPSVGNPT